MFDRFSGITDRESALCRELLGGTAIFIAGVKTFTTAGRCSMAREEGLICGLCACADADAAGGLTGHRFRNTLHCS